MSEFIKNMFIRYGAFIANNLPDIPTFLDRLGEGMLLELLQLVDFKLPMHLGVTSYTINTNVQPALPLSSGCWIQFLFPHLCRDYDL